MFTGIHPRNLGGTPGGAATISLRVPAAVADALHAAAAAEGLKRSEIIREAIETRVAVHIGQTS